MQPGEDLIVQVANSAATMRPGKIPIVEVAFGKDMWWSLPADTSHTLYQQHLNGEDAGYVWDWGNHRTGSFVLEEQPTSLSRYGIDFREKLQTNLDNGRRRTIRIVWIDQDDEEPRYTGQKLQE